MTQKESADRSVDQCPLWDLTESRFQLCMPSGRLPLRADRLLGCPKVVLAIEAEFGFGFWLGFCCPFWVFFYWLFLWLYKHDLCTRIVWENWRVLGLVVWEKLMARCLDSVLRSILISWIFGLICNPCNLVIWTRPSLFCPEDIGKLSNLVKSLFSSWFFVFVLYLRSWLFLRCCYSDLGNWQWISGRYNNILVPFVIHTNNTRANDAQLRKKLSSYYSYNLH